MFSGHRIKQQSKLAAQIRLSYLILLLPNLVFMIYALYNLFLVSERYNTMLNSVVTASEFSLDFKEDFDYETYLLIVGNVAPEDSNIPTLLNDAKGVVDGLKGYTNTDDNQKRLSSAEKYLKNLEIYIDRINNNLKSEDKYEDNMLIWENDVQIVTSLLQETINEYIYYENKQIQVAQAKNKEIFLDIIKISFIITIVIFMIILLVSYVGPIWITRPIEEQVKQEQKQLRKAEFELLQAQINPHFLYNTLDTIIWSAEAGNQKQVVNMVKSLSDFFRASLNRGKEIVTVKEELQHVRSYLEIQQIRYQDILSYKIEVEDTIYDYSIPKITIQPVVENALYHGIKNKRGGGCITVTGREYSGHFEISVEDDGKGMTPERLKDVSMALKAEKLEEKNAVYGLYNVNQRIKLNFGDEYGMEIDSTYDKGTKVVIKLPKNLTEIVEK
ncbi:MAG: sensor histidine kinase [Butyrivibrio sp.]|uniref:sensor histidine kinase n=1 Tax=Butyrivibrio sp. TaxID=28121 RepID=UPI001B14353F|nr:sensor histidine kinase [Butyrivibrio sp.]MBO6242072.1 sensor histidine kinase [Butyrivibrio sp.]